MKKLLVLFLLFFSPEIHAQQDLKNTKWVLDETDMLIHISEMQVMTFKACSNREKIKTKEEPFCRLKNS